MTFVFALVLLGAMPPAGAPAGRAARIGELLAPTLPGGARLTALAIEPPLPASCAPVRVRPARPLVASGRVALRLEGAGCPGWTWAQVRIQRDDPAPAASLPAGTPVRIVARVGSLTVAEVGRIVPCVRDAVCAVTPAGKHVEGRLEGGALVVEVP
ncbi:MAG: hypothetical protein ABUS79_09275 [Pseudomonadota bacterium]